MLCPYLLHQSKMLALVVVWELIGRARGLPGTAKMGEHGEGCILVSLSGHG